MKLFFATGNTGKLREAREILGTSFEVLNPAEMGYRTEVEETGSTFAENSLLKARHLAVQGALPCFADDSGLEVDALGGAPGIYSARYASDHNFSDNIARLHSELDKIFPQMPDSQRLYPGAARFRCVVTLLLRDGVPHYFEGSVEGRIARRRKGECGFGYDPVFVPDLFPDRTMAEISEESKNAISHRGLALAGMVEFLKQLRQHGK